MCIVFKALALLEQPGERTMALDFLRVVEEFPGGLAAKGPAWSGYQKKEGGRGRCP